MRQRLLFFVALAAVIAVILWLGTDWSSSAYVGGQTRTKFTLPVQVQIAISVCAGVIGSAICMCIHWLILDWRRRNK